jgi:drug/metabolite transporter (DMT)-like permease
MPAVELYESPSTMLKGLALALGASLSWALANVAIQRTGRAMGAVRALFWAQISALPVAMALSLVLERRHLSSAGVLGWTLLAGVAGLIAYVPLFDAFEHGPLSVVVPIASSWSVLTTALDVASGNGLRAPQAFGTLLVLVGIVLVARSVYTAERPDRSRCSQCSPLHAVASTSQPAPARRRARERRAVGGAALAALGFGVMIPALRALTPALGSIGSVAASYAVALSLGLSIACAVRHPVTAPSGRLWVWVAGTGALETLGFVLVNTAEQYAPLSIVGPAASLSPPLTVAYAWLFLSERPGRLAIWGGLVACFGLLLLGK